MRRVGMVGCQLAARVMEAEAVCPAVVGHREEVSGTLTAASEAEAGACQRA